MRFNLDNYETVESRLARFWEQFPNGRIATEMVYYDENRVVFKASMYKDINDTVPVSTGYAEELRDASPVNRTSHVENCETSSIGRCASNYIFQSKTAPRPSREEMSKVARAEQPKPQGQDLLTKFREACAKQNIDPQDVAKEAGLNFGELTDADMPKLRDAFKKLTDQPAEKPASKQVEDAEAFIEKVKEAFPAATEQPVIKDPDSPASQPQIAKIRAMLNGQGFGPMNEKIEACAEIINRPIKKMEQLTKGEASVVINSLESRIK